MNRYRVNARPLMTGIRTGRMVRVGSVMALLGLALLMLATIQRFEAAAADGRMTEVVVCTDSGFKRLTLDSEGHPVNPSSNHHHVCVCCLAAPDLDDQVVLEGGALSVPPPAAKTARLVWPAEIVPQRYFRDGHESRAPPQVV